MEEKLDFSLPVKKSKKSFKSVIIIALLLMLIVIGTTDILRNSACKEFSVGATSSLSAEQTKQLAAKLADRNLYSRAAEVWQDYLSAGNLPNTEQAKTLFQIATLFEKAGSYDQAIEYYYRSEISAELADLEPQINSHLKDCFQKLGRFSALRNELAERTSFSKPDQAGGKIVAEIGSEKINQADLDALVESTIDNKLVPMAGFMTADQFNDQKKKMLEQYKDASAKEQFLQSWIVQEILYRQALQEQLVDDPKVKNFVDELTRDALSRVMMNKQLGGKINITETDLQTYYEANKVKFMEPTDPNDPNSVMKQKTFEQVKDQAANELISSKAKDVQQSFIKQLMDKYNVIIHNSVLNHTDKTADGK